MNRVLIGGIQQFLDLLKAGDFSSEQRLRALPKALDELAYLVHRTPATDATETPDPPKRNTKDSEERSREVGRLFPDLGFYVAGSHIDELGKPMVGDATGDLVEIAEELEEVLWRWKNNGADDAYWQLRFGYCNHWGQHLRDLSSHLHALLSPDRLLDD